MDFSISRATRVAAQWNSAPVQRAILRFQRDMEKTLSPADCTPNNEIVICLSPRLAPESYTLDLQDEHSLIVCAADDLGAVYALLYLSREYLGVLPFWFWNDQLFEQKALVTVSLTHYASPQTAVGLRGWALDAEPLLDAWASEENAGWEMAFEALLRCGGNTVLLPAGAEASLAAAMGLWLMQPEAEPLGAAPLTEVYPHVPPLWPDNADACRTLWAEAVSRQKARNTVWHLGYRAPNGEPFWVQDPACNTMEQRGKRLGDILRVQYDLLRAAAPTAPVYTALNAEEAAMYRAGVLSLPSDVLLLWDGGGYDMPHSKDAPFVPVSFSAPPQGKSPFVPVRHGITYRLAGHGAGSGCNLTMWPDDAEAICRDLQYDLSLGINGLWLLRAPGLKPHLYPLDLAASLWRDPTLGSMEHRLDYLRDYYRAPDGWPLSNSALDDLATCLKAWPDSTAVLSATPTLHLGEEFLCCSTRAFAAVWLCGQTKAPVAAVRRRMGDHPFGEQLTMFRSACVAAMPKFETLLAGSDYARRRTTALWQDTVQLQVRLYLLCLHGAVRFCDACALYYSGEYRQCFLLLGDAAGDFSAADALLLSAEHGRWAGFYANDPYTDCRGTAAVLYSVMSLARAAGDIPAGSWQNEALQGVPTPRLDDKALFSAMQKQK